MTQDSRDIFAVAYRLYERWENVPEGLGVQGQFEWLGAMTKDFGDTYAKVSHNNSLACDLWSGMMSTVMEQFDLKYPAETREGVEADTFFAEYAKKFQFVKKRGESP